MRHSAVDAADVPSRLLGQLDPSSAQAHEARVRVRAGKQTLPRDEGFQFRENRVGLFAAARWVIDQVKVALNDVGAATL
jgi:hypothetical protein